MQLPVGPADCDCCSCNHGVLVVNLVVFNNRILTTAIVTAVYLVNLENNNRCVYRFETLDIQGGAGRLLGAPTARYTTETIFTRQKRQRYITLYKYVYKYKYINN